MTVLLLDNRGPVRILTMNRPEKRNALNSELTQGLLDALRAADADESVGAIVLTGAGQGFCAGADLSEFKDLQQAVAAENRAELTMQLHLAFSRISKPIVSAINGHAMGGGAGLAIAADLAVMAEGAKIGYPEPKHGIVAAIVMANLVRQVGRKAAFELVSLGEPVDAQRALQLGMVNRICPSNELLPAALSLAEKLASVKRVAMTETKRLFHEVADMALAPALERGRDTNKRMRNFQQLAGKEVKPLDGLTILDLSRVLACPFASMILAELGARVIKVEQPGSGDETRSFEPQLAKDSAYYFACNRSKESITVNLRSDEGRKTIRELAQRADVVLENFPVGTLARYGLDFAVLSSLNEKLIFVSCTGFGQTGPYAEKKGYDTVFQAMGGIMSLTGEKDGGPVKPGLPVADLTSGLWIAIAILAALAGRTRTGKGCHVDFSMLDGQVSLLTLAAARYFALGEIPPRLGTEHPGRVPSATFRCKDGKYAHITASDQHWAPLCKALGIEEWGKAFSDNAKRVDKRPEVMQVLTDKISAMERSRLLATLDEVDVPVGPVNDVAEILADPHVRARRLVGSFDYPGVGEFKALALPYKFLGWDNPEIGRPPLLGEHTEAILAELRSK